MCSASPLRCSPLSKAILILCLDNDYLRGNELFDYKHLQQNPIQCVFYDILVCLQCVVSKQYV